MKLICAWILGISLATAVQIQAEEPSPGALLKQRVDMMLQLRQLDQEASKASGELRGKYHGTNSAIQLLRGPALTPERVASMEAEIARLKGQLASTEMQLEVAKITDPAEKTKKIAELEAQSKKLDAEALAAEAPIRAQRDTIGAPLKATDAAFSTALDKHFKDAADKNPGGKRNPMHWVSVNNNGQIQWMGPDGKQRAWAAVFLQSQPASNNGGPQIDGKYQMMFSGSTNVIGVNVGYFTIHLNINDKEWQGDDAKRIELLKALIDLDGLAALKPE